jgi:hypothetical protein
MSSKRKEILK